MLVLFVVAFEYAMDASVICCWCYLLFPLSMHWMLVLFVVLMVLWFHNQLYIIKIFNKVYVVHHSKEHHV